MHAVVDMEQGCVVQGTGSYTSLQGSVYARGISAETVGAKAVFLGRVTFTTPWTTLRCATPTSSNTGKVVQ